MRALLTKLLDVAIVCALAYTVQTAESIVKAWSMTAMFTENASCSGNTTGEVSKVVFPQPEWGRVR